MATIKAYTNIEQSKKLAEILPTESADMEWINSDGLGEPFPFVGRTNDDEGLPCWSLAALLSVLPMITKGKENANPFIAKTPDNEYYVVYATFTEEVDVSVMCDNPVDACYDIIIYLHKLNLL